MGNNRFQSHPGSGAKTGQVGPRHDTVGPMKTKAWASVPGPTQRKARNAGIKKMKQSASEKGI